MLLALIHGIYFVKILCPSPSHTFSYTHTPHHHTHTHTKKQDKGESTHIARLVAVSLHYQGVVAVISTATSNILCTWTSN